MTTKQKIDDTTNKVHAAATKALDKTKEMVTKGAAAVEKAERNVADAVTQKSNEVSEAATKMGHDVKHAAKRAVHAVEEKVQEEKIRATAALEMTRSKLQHSAEEKTDVAIDEAAELTQKAKHATDRAARKAGN